MRNVSIRTKITGLVALFGLGLAFFVGMIQQKTKEKLEDSEYNEVVETKDLVADILPPPLYVVEALAVALEMGQETNAAALTDLRSRWKQLESDHGQRHAYWSEHLASGALRSALLDGAGEIARKFFSVGDDRLLPAVQAGDRTKTQAAITALKEIYTAHRARIDEVVKLSNQRAEEKVNAAAAAVRARKIEFLVIGILIAGVGAVFGVIIVRDISRRVRQTSDLLEGVASGDLRHRLTIDSEDELGQMGKSLNGTLDAIEEALVGVRKVASTVASAAGKLSSQSEHISSGAQEQASSLEETAASLEQITATVKQSAGNAQQASQLALGSREVAQNGGSVVGEAVNAMNEITKASHRIGDIITTIDEIALQTNLLALNAAVEAARAGEQGRGFAVVASEVGSLAQRSAGAAKEVKTLISDTLARVDAGQKLVDQSGRTLQEIITSVKKVTDIVGDIAAASREQSAGVDQVNQAVSQMDQVTQSNAAETEQLAGTAQELADSAEQLRKAVGRFQLSKTDDTPPAPRPRAHRPARADARSPRRERRPVELPRPVASNDWEVSGQALPAPNTESESDADGFEAV